MTGARRSGVFASDRLPPTWMGRSLGSLRDWVCTRSVDLFWSRWCGLFGRSLSAGCRLGSDGLQECEWRQLRDGVCLSL